MTDTTSIVRPFRAGWIDRFNRWVANLPVPAWIFFVAFGFALLGVQVLLHWLDRGLNDMELLPIIIFNGFFTPFLLALLLVLDEQAVSALDAMRPVLATNESEFAHYRYRLSNMPAGAALIAGLALLVMVVILEQLGRAPIRYGALEQLPIFAIPFHIIDKSSAFLFGVFVYHTVRQLYLVQRITAHHLRVSLFDREPQQAFARLTASTAVGLVVGVYAWMLLNPELLTDPVSMGFVAAITLMAVVAFVLPLLGVHRHLAIAKHRMLHALDLHFESASSEFEERLQHDDYPAVEQLGEMLATLGVQRQWIEGIPTWPWRPRTARFVFTAIATPSVLASLRFLFEQVFRS
jgi:hypothetical protein